MILLKLFLTFLKIGAFTFGGGYGMISIVREAAVSNGWLTEAEFLNLIAVAESTPGPIAINMATYIGSSQGDTLNIGFIGRVLGALCSTIGIVLPSFVIILIIASFIANLIKFAGVKAFLNGVRPCVVGLIIATSITLGLSTLFNITTINNGFSVDFKAILIFAIIFLFATIMKKLKKKLSPFIMIAISAFLGIALYSF